MPTCPFFFNRLLRCSPAVFLVIRFSKTGVGIVGSSGRGFWCCLQRRVGGFALSLTGTFAAFFGNDFEIFNRGCCPFKVIIFFIPCLLSFKCCTASPSSGMLRQASCSGPYPLPGSRVHICTLTRFSYQPTTGF